MNKDAVVGLFTILLVAVVGLYHSFRDHGLVKFNTQVGLLFTQVHGLRIGDPVTVAGAPAGRVVDIDFAPQDVQEALDPLTGGTILVRAMVALDTFQEIPKESTYTVQTDLNGRRWIDITASPSAEMIGADELFFAEEQVVRDDKVQRTIRTLTILSEQTKDLRDELSSPEFRLRTKDTASNLRFYSREMVLASEQAPGQLQQFSDSLDRQEAEVHRQLASLNEKTREVSARMLEMTPQITENLQGWTRRMERQSDRLSATLVMATEKTKEYEELLDEMVVKRLDPESVKQLITQTKKWGRKLQEYRYLAEDLHALTSDPTVRADLKTAIAEFEKKSRSLNDRLLELEHKIDTNPLTTLGEDAGK